MRILLSACLISLSAIAIGQSTMAISEGTLHFKGITPVLHEADAGIFSDELFAGVKKHEDEEREIAGMQSIPTGTVEDVDAALQKETDITTTGITVLSSWEGLKSKYLRSDNNMAVGPNHVVQMINSALFSSYIRVWNKSGDLLISKAEMLSLVGEPDYGDPNIIYDEKADRFVISFLYSDHDARLIIMASVTGDPTGAWYYYDFETTGGFPDYEKLAVWGDSYILTTAQANPNVYVLKRDDILNGIGASPVLRFPLPKFKNIGWQSASPVTETGSMDIPAGEPAIVWRVWDNWWHPPYSDIDQLELFSLHINWADPFASFMSGPTALPIELYNSNLCGVSANTCLEQPGTGVRLWPVSNFITDKSKYMNFGDHQSIVGVHVCRANEAGTAGQRWYELRKYPGGEWSIYQQSTYAPTDDHRFMGSISINEDGTIALGYNITSTTVYPGIRMTARTSCDPLDQMTAPEVVGQAGTASNKTLDYGDYNGLVTDPVDGTFWFTAQYNVSNKWSTRVVHFSVDGCDGGRETASAVYSIAAVAPNPANTEIQINYMTGDVQDAAISIYNMQGELLFSQQVAPSSTMTTKRIDVNGYPAGMYQCVLHSGEKFSTMQFMVQH